MYSARRQKIATLGLNDQEYINDVYRGKYDSELGINAAGVIIL